MHSRRLRACALASLPALGSLLATDCMLPDRDREVQPCEYASECHAAFGFGYTCDETSGLCKPLSSATHEDCRSDPADLLSAPEKYREAVVFGHLVDHSANLEQEYRERAAMVALRQVNGVDADVGILGHGVGMVFCRYTAGEAASDPKSVVALGRYLSSTLGLPAIVGPSGSEHASDLFEAIKRDRQTLLITPSATSELLQGIDPPPEKGNGLLWRTVPTDASQAAQMADLVVAQGIRRVLVLFQDDTYGQSLANDVRDAIEDRVDRLESVIFPLRADVASNRSKVRDAVAEAFAKIRPNAPASEEPQAPTQGVIFIASNANDVAVFLEEVSLVSDYYRDSTIFLTDSGANDKVLSTVPVQVQTHILGTRPYVDTGAPTYRDFVDAYKLTHGKDELDKDPFMPHTFDATWLAFYGAAYSLIHYDIVTAEGIARGLTQVSDPKAQKPSPFQSSQWVSAVSQLEAGHAINVVGASGLLDYDGKTEELASDPKNPASGTFEPWKVVAGIAVPLSSLP